MINFLESFKSGIITKTLDDVMFDHPLLDLRSCECYDPNAMESADDDLMKAVLSPLAFPFLDDLQSSTWIKLFEEILSSPVDEDEDYRRFSDQGVRSSLHPESLGLILSGQPLGILANLTAELEKASR